jgi:hypothetical protein
MTRTPGIPSRRLLSLALLWVVLGSAAAWAEDAREILSRSLAPGPLAYTGVQVTVAPDAPRPNRAFRPQRVYRSGNRLRIDYANGQILIDDGDHQDLYLPRRNLVQRSPSRLDPRRIRTLLRALHRHMVSPELLPEAAVAGRPTYVVDVKAPAGGEHRFWIDKETYLQLRHDETGPDGKNTSTYFTSISYVAPPALLLSFTPPSDATIIDRRPLTPATAAAMARPWGGPLLPTYTAGYRFRGYFQHAFKGQPVLVATYAGPGKRNTLSVFQGPAIGTAGVVEREAGSLVVTGRVGSADVAVVAPAAVPETELRKVLASLAPAP